MNIFIYKYLFVNPFRFLYIWHNDDQAQSAATRYAPVEPLCHHYFFHVIYVYIYIFTCGIYMYIYIYIYICSPNAVVIIRAHLYIYICIYCYISYKRIYIYICNYTFVRVTMPHTPLAFVSFPFGLKSYHIFLSLSIYICVYTLYLMWHMGPGLHSLVIVLHRLPWNGTCCILWPRCFLFSWSTKDQLRAVAHFHWGPASPLSPMSPSAKILQDPDGVLAVGVGMCGTWADIVSTWFPNFNLRLFSHNFSLSQTVQVWE